VGRGVFGANALQMLDVSGVSEDTVGARAPSALGSGARTLQQLCNMASQNGLAKGGTFN
jgi:hypothetical protein